MHALELRGLVKRFGASTAVDSLDLVVPSGSFTGVVGPNGAGKTTTLSMATGLVRPDAGTALVFDVDIWQRGPEAKRMIGNLGDGGGLDDRLTGEQLITFSGLLYGLDRDTVRDRATDLLRLLDLEAAASMVVAAYSAGMTKRIALAAARGRPPRLLVLDEPFESVGPVSAANIRDILEGFVASGGTVVVSSHSMDLVERMCDRVAIVAGGRVLAAGTLDEVRGDGDLESRFIELIGGRRRAEHPSWLQSS